MKITINEAGWDRIARVIAGIALLAIGLSGVISSGAWGIVIAAVGGMLLLTGLVGWCPLYTFLHIRTNK
jgi:hypothetical protein